MGMVPQMGADQSERIGEGGKRLHVLRGPACRDFAMRGEVIGEQSHDREQAEQRWGCPSDGQGRPQVSGFYARMRADFLEGYRYLPPPVSPMDKVELRVSPQLSTAYFALASL